MQYFDIVLLLYVSIFIIQDQKPAYKNWTAINCPVFALLFTVNHSSHAQSKSQIVFFSLFLSQKNDNCQ